MADSSSANTNSSASQTVETVRSSTGTPTSVFRAWARSRGGASEAMKHRVRLLEALTKYVHANGGYVVSQPGSKVVRIEIAKDSDLPTKLAHYHPIQCGQTLRTSYRGFELFDVIEIALEKMAAPRDEL